MNRACSYRPTPSLGAALLNISRTAVSFACHSARRQLTRDQTMSVDLKDVRLAWLTAAQDHLENKKFDAGMDALEYGDE